MTRVLVFGSRDWVDPFPIWCVLNGYLADDLPVTLLNGRSRGADAVAWKWAKLNGIERDPYPADWGRYGKAAGPLRNQRMVEEGNPDVAWGFVTDPLPESRGSFDMAVRLHAARVPCHIVARPVTWGVPP